ncbi:Lrp/AsnC family transcriptional regulator [Geosporobacter ferrireducens]|uniref:siroheme decarboxylase n=1 Tax=Geosporobacter ferrireducens TaxID=1424294 RepID=A0A1D8GE38_9FIRM|nr:Lrp/AsnC family transcriptional regulator [Geosporobacter ferrireducens]AOT69166.1 hypothetical protein Gferi_06070 [Geosporobacter ferrireducens]MTI56843.1 Lrp/AsnC family transcriptional regulator [Geosporobacter ferrireducens]
MTEIEKLVLNELQKGIPLVERPFMIIGEKLRISEDAVIDIVNVLKRKDYIRRFGGILDVNKLDVKSILIGMKVEPQDIKRVTTLINAYKGVTHNYERKDDYNLWFTLMEQSQKKLNETIAEIRVKTGVKEMLCLPSIKKYKTSVFFRFD